MVQRRVVITGLGTVSPLGLGVEATWSSALAGKSGVSTITHFDASKFSTKFAATVDDFKAEDYMDKKDAKKCDPFIQYGVASSKEAVLDAGLDDLTGVDPLRCGVIMGSGIGGIKTIEDSSITLHDSGPRRVSPFFIPSSIVNMISGHVSIMFGFKGLTLAPATACTTGTHSIGLAFRSIVYGDADVVVAGGAEKASTPLGISGFAAARALSTRNDSPETASRPWDKGRDGFVLGDGAASVVLEEYEHAKKRGAKIYAEVVGFGMSSDAFHITRPSGDGAYQAMSIATKDAKIEPSKIDYINAHGTSTQAGDIEESKAVSRLMQNDASKVMISSTKSMTGHLLGAAGAIESLFTIKAIQEGKVPPTINLHDPDDGADLDYVPNVARDANIEYALSNSFGFGGTNGSLIFKKFEG